MRGSKPTNNNTTFFDLLNFLTPYLLHQILPVTVYPTFFPGTAEAHGESVLISIATERFKSVPWQRSRFAWQLGDHVANMCGKFWHGNFLVWKETIGLLLMYGTLFWGEIGYLCGWQTWKGDSSFKGFFAVFFLSLSSELFSFIEGMPEISHGNSKVPYLNRKYIPVYTFFQTIINSCFSFP